MPHEGSGYYYYSYEYRCPYTESNGERKVEEGFRSAFYTEVSKQAHKTQTDWRKYMVMPAVRKQIEEFHLPNLKSNKKGRTYDPYNEKNVVEKAFNYCNQPPPASKGPLVAIGEFAGNELQKTSSKYAR
jgi:hypothetical protein